MSAQKIFNVEGKVAFVTGAGSGLGRAMAAAIPRRHQWSCRR